MLCFARYSITWLDAVTNPKPLYHNPDIVPRVYWDSSLSLDNLQEVDYTQLLEEERLSNGKTERSEDIQRPVLKQLLTNLLAYGFAFIDNTPTDLASTTKATGVISFPQVG